MAKQAEGNISVTALAQVRSRAALPEEALAKLAERCKWCLRSFETTRNPLLKSLRKGAFGQWIESIPDPNSYIFSHELVMGAQMDFFVQLQTEPFTLDSGSWVVDFG